MVCQATTMEVRGKAGHVSMPRKQNLFSFSPPCLYYFKTESQKLSCNKEVRLVMSNSGLDHNLQMRGNSKSILGWDNIILNQSLGYPFFDMISHFGKLFHQPSEMNIHCLWWRLMSCQRFSSCNSLKLLWPTYVRMKLFWLLNWLVQE